MRTELLDQLCQLSREFGTSPYVHAGGGNVSVKSAGRLWIKPSGMALCEMTPERFLEMDRSALNAIYAAQPPENTHERERVICGMMMRAVLSKSGGRPSVETPLHNLFDAAYVVHTHMTLLNGPACARGGAAACRELFPEALWVKYVDPGYTLSMHVREALRQYAARHARQPSVVILKNHGVFVAEETPDAVRDAYSALERTLRARYKSRGVSTRLAKRAPADEETLAEARARVRDVFGSAAAFIHASPSFEVAEGPVTPDHIVYAKSFPFVDALTKERADAFVQRRGYAPRVVAADQAVFGIGETDPQARAALALAEDGALIRQLSQAFGGVEYLDDAAREFIENWEVETYRARISLGESAS